MELTKQELFLLCQIAKISALPGYEIPMRLDKEEAKVAYKALEDKKIMENQQLSKHGLAVTKSIYNYAKAKKFIKIGQGSFAYIGEKHYIMLNKTKNYTIEITQQEEIIASILVKFTTWEQIKQKEYKKQNVTKEKFKQIMEENATCEVIFYYAVDIEKKEEKKAVMFIADGYFQHYDQMTEILESSPAENVQKVLEGVFA